MVVFNSKVHDAAMRYDQFSDRIVLMNSLANFLYQLASPCSDFVDVPSSISAVRVSLGKYHADCCIGLRVPDSPHGSINVWEHVCWDFVPRLPNISHLKA